MRSIARVEMRLPPRAGPPCSLIFITNTLLAFAAAVHSTAFTVCSKMFVMKEREKNTFILCCIFGLVLLQYYILSPSKILGKNTTVEYSSVVVSAVLLYGGISGNLPVKFFAYLQHILVFRFENHRCEYLSATVL